MAIEPIYGMYVHDEVTDTDGIAKFSSEELEDIRVGADGTTYANAGDAVRGQAKKLKDDLGQNTYNLFDTHKMSSPGIIVDNGTVNGLASAFNTSFTNGIPLNITFEPNTQYTWSFKAKNNGNATSGNGLNFKFIYTDDSVDANSIPNNTTIETPFHFTSASGKTVAKLSISYSSAGSNNWELKDIQLEKGTVSNDYIPHITANDVVARIIANKNVETLDYVDNVLFITNYYDKWEQGNIDANNGQNIGSDTTVRTSDFIPTCQKIETANDYLVALYAFDNTGYIGYYKTNGEIGTTGAIARLAQIDMLNLPSNYSYKLSVFHNNENITPSEVYENVYLIKYRFLTYDMEHSSNNTDLFLVRKTIPSYYFDLPNATDDFYDTEYLNQKINSIPDGKHFIFITDPHWKNNNEKNSTQLLKYVKDKVGIKDIFQGGDILNQELSKYSASAQMSLYMNELKDAFDNHFLCVQGNHDKNVANLSQVLENNPGLQESDVALPYDVIYNIEMSHFAERVHFDDWSNWLTRTGATGSDLSELDAYRKLHYYMDDNDQKIRYIVICATNTVNNGVVKQYFGASSLNEACLQYEWFRDTLKSTPSSYDIVVISHVIVNDKKDGTGTWLPYDQIGYYLRMMAGYATKTNVIIRNLVGTSSPEGALLDTFFASGNHTMQFKDANTFTGTIFMIGGDCHCDVLCKHNINNISSFIENGDTVDVTNGEIPAITTLCDARAVPSIDKYGNREIMTAGTVTEQCFEVVTITNDKKIVLTRFGAGEDRQIKLS